jgi:hypothetical protein
VATLSLYSWGFLGGAVAALVVYAIPELIHAARTDAPENMTPARAALIAALVLVLAAIAGVVPLIPDDPPSRGHAIAYGLAANSILRGIISGAQDAVRPPRPLPGVDFPST